MRTLFLRAANQEAKQWIAAVEKVRRGASSPALLVSPCLSLLTFPRCYVVLLLLCLCSCCISLPLSPPASGGRAPLLNDYYTRHAPRQVTAKAHEKAIEKANPSLKNAAQGVIAANRYIPSNIWSENISEDARCPKKVWSADLSKSVDSDTCPRPTTQVSESADSDTCPRPATG